MKPIRSPYSLGQLSERQRRRGVLNAIITLLASMAFAWFLTGCSCTGLSKQSLDQVNAAIASAEGFKERAERGEAVAPVLVDVHLDNLNGLKKNLERAVNDE